MIFFVSGIVAGMATRQEAHFQATATPEMKRARQEEWAWLAALPPRKPTWDDRMADLAIFMAFAIPGVIFTAVWTGIILMFVKIAARLGSHDFP